MDHGIIQYADYHPEYTNYYLTCLVYRLLFGIYRVLIGINILNNIRYILIITFQ